MIMANGCFCLNLLVNKKNMNVKNNEKIKKIKEQLVSKKKMIIAQLQKFAKKNEKVKDDFKTEFPNLGHHQDENAIEVSDYESKLSVERDLESELKNIEGALKKTSENTYGVCSVCGERINPKRLEIMPEATLCVKCSEKQR
jgi:DnaK suppressor protein